MFWSCYDVSRGSSTKIKDGLREGYPLPYGETNGTRSVGACDGGAAIAQRERRSPHHHHHHLHLSSFLRHDSEQKWYWFLVSVGDGQRGPGCSELVFVFRLHATQSSYKISTHLYAYCVDIILRVCAQFCRLFLIVGVVRIACHTQPYKKKSSNSVRGIFTQVCCCKCLNRHTTPLH